MSDITIPVETVWDIVANALDDPWFWFMAVGGMVSASLLLRYLHRRAYRCRYPRSSRA